MDIRKGARDRCKIQLLVTDVGKGTPAVAGEPLRLKAVKSLPASD